jgi:SAM-dependent methyltransferase
MSPDDFANYSLHFERMQNQPPDWELADRHPDRIAFHPPWLPADRSVRILDAGCGMGHMLMNLWCRGFRHLEGVEISSSQCRIARNAAGDRVEIHQGDAIEFLAGRRSAYDVILSFDVIEHMPVEQAHRLLQAAFQALKPAGTIVLRTPNMASIQGSYSRYLDITHVAGYTEYSLMQLLDSAGFQDHRFVPDPVVRPHWRYFRPWAPWKPFDVRLLVNIWLHRLIYWARDQRPRPTVHSMNLEAWSRKPAAE